RNSVGPSYFSFPRERKRGYSAPSTLLRIPRSLQNQSWQISTWTCSCPLFLSRFSEYSGWKNPTSEIGRAQWHSHTAFALCLIRNPCGTFLFVVISTALFARGFLQSS